MNTRTQLIKKILPHIDANNSSASVMETFQNDTLRPILKFQNTLIISYFEHFVIESKIDFVKMEKVARTVFLTAFSVANLPSRPVIDSKK